MFNSNPVPPVAANELLTRFILFSKHIRTSEHSVKPDAFMPHPRTETSLTRHQEATIEEIWQEGDRVASLRVATLYGRADVQASVFLGVELSVEARPIQQNPNHADAIGWPIDKAAQKMKATEIAAASALVYKSR